MLTYKQSYPLIQANPKMAADMNLVNLEFKQLYKIIGDIVAGKTVIINNGTGGGGENTRSYDWSNLYKAGTQISARQAFGDWNTNLDSLAVHEQKNVDPHSADLIQSGSVTIGNSAYWQRTLGEYLKVAAAPALSGSAVFGNMAFYPVNTDTSRTITGLGVTLQFDGTNKAASNIDAFSPGVTLNGSAAWPATSQQPVACMDVNQFLGASFSGSIDKFVGIWLNPSYHASASGTVTEMYAVDCDNTAIYVAGKVATYAHINLPTPPANATASYLMRLGLGSILATDDLTFLFNASTKKMCISNPGQSAAIEIGTGATGNNFAYLDFVGDTTYTDYGLRIIRGNAGANSTSSLYHRGTGVMQLVSTDKGAILVGTTTDTPAGFHGASAVQANAYTQTYSTAARTVPNMTSADITPGAGAFGASSAANFAAMVTSFKNLRGDVLALFQLVNALIDDLQGKGIAG